MSLQGGAASPAASLDHLVGAGEKRGRHIESQRPGRGEVDDQFELGRLQDRQIGRLLAREIRSRRAFCLSSDQNETPFAIRASAGMSVAVLQQFVEPLFNLP